MDQHKLQVTVSDHSLEQLEALAADVGGTLKEVFDEAMSLYEFAVSEAKQGRKIGTIQQESGGTRFREVLAPLLDRAYKGQ